MKVEDVPDDEDNFAYSKSLLPSPGAKMEPSYDALYQQVILLIFRLSMHSTWLNILS